jgi:hypothetical protein
VELSFIPFQPSRSSKPVTPILWIGQAITIL